MADESIIVAPDEAMTPPASYKVIYVYTDTHPDHKGRVKIGDATLHTSKASEEITSQEIYEAAKRRIDSYTKTADIVVNILHTELALRPVITVDANGNKTPTGAYETFRDYKVHEVLMRGGYKKTFTREDKRNGEWFVAPVEVVKTAIAAVKAGDFYFSKATSAIKLRPEQEKAVKQTLKCFQGATAETPRRMLWNAKMRFGKTLTTCSLVNDLEETGLYDLASSLERVG